MPDVVRSIEIKAPPSVVWQYMATQESLRQWLSPNLEIDLQVGGAYHLRGPDDETWISGSVLELIPEGSIVLSWLEHDATWQYPARLVITLAATAAGTRVTLIHDGFAGIGKPGWRDTLQAYERGVDRHRILERLAALAAAPVG